MTATLKTTHELVEFEVAAAYLDGIEMGIRLAGEAVERAVAEALRRPDGHGGPDLDVAARETAARLFGAYLGVGVAPR